MNPTYLEPNVLLRIAEGDETAFKLLFDQYWQPLYAVAITLVKSHEPAKDIVQEIFVKIWDKRAQLPEKKNLKNFVFIVARNHIFNELRKKSNEEAFSEYIIEHFAEKSETALEQLIVKESRELIEDALKQLPEQQRVVYLMTREYGLSQQEISARLKISNTTVKTHMSRALSSIRNYILKQAPKDALIFILIQEILKKY